MSAQQNKQNAQDAYAAFGNSDAEAAMRHLDDSIAWTERGDNALTGTHDGKQAVGELWGKLMSKDFSTAPHGFVAEGDRCVRPGSREVSERRDGFHFREPLVSGGSRHQSAPPRRLLVVPTRWPWLGRPRPHGRHGRVADGRWDEDQFEGRVRSRWVSSAFRQMTSASM